MFNTLNVARTPLSVATRHSLSSKTSSSLHSSTRAILGSLIRIGHSQENASGERIRVTQRKLCPDQRSGELNAFAELYDRYARLVRCLSFDGTGNLNDANDLCQEVFMKAFRQLKELREPSRFGFWLTGITRNTIVDWKRRQSRERVTFVESVPEPVTDADDKQHAIENRATEPRAQIRELPEAERMALHLFYVDEQPAETARQVLNLSRSGFYKVLGRARELLAERMRTTEAASDE